MNWILGILGLVLGGAIGAALAVIWGNRRQAGIQQQATQAQSRAEMLDAQIRDRIHEIDGLHGKLSLVDDRREAAERQTAVLTEQLAERQRSLDEQRRLLQDTERRFSETFNALSAAALKSNSTQFIELASQTFGKYITQAFGDVEKKQQAIDALIKPIRELLDKQNTVVGEIEKKRETAYARLDEQIKAMASSHDGLRTETGKLVSALRRPEQRGRWGEMQLRNAVEMSGMTEHCDFDEQVTVWKGDESQRPDMVVKMPGGGRIIVDAKVAIDAYLDSLQQSDGDRAATLDRHARHVSTHVQKLAEKQYWKQFEHAPEWVVMFMPLESALIAALEREPDLQMRAMQQHVLIATPTLLVALLASIACGWQREHIAANAREISKTGKELHERLAKFTDSFARIGAALTKSSEAYNSAIGTLEGRVLPSARRLRDLHATTDEEIAKPESVDVVVREVAAAELRQLSQSPNE